MSGVRVLVGTRKGAFILTSDGKRQEWDVSGPHFGGWEIYHVAGSPEAMANELGMRNVCFEIDDMLAVVDGLRAKGYGLVGGVGEWEDAWRMAYVRGPEGIVVSLTERIG